MKTLILLPILLLTIVVASPLEIPRAHAATGLVCLADPTTANPSSPCPSSPPIFSGPKGEQIRIGVYISGSDPMDGFDITLLTNESVLVPAYASSNTVDLTGSVINVPPQGPAVTILLCVNGLLVAGTTCQNPDRADTIHFAATAALGTPLTANPTTGLLFTALFNITETSSGAQPIGFQSPVSDKNGNPLPECRSGTSVPNYCVTVANGSSTPNTETIQTATFNNSGASSMQSVALSTNSTVLGPEFPGVSNHVNITATPLNGYSINSTNPVQFTSIAPGLTANLSPTSCSTAGVLCSSLLTITTTSSGNYSVTVAGSYQTVDSSGNPDTLSAYVNLFVDVYDFGFTINGTSATFVSGEIHTLTATISSQNGFAGAVALSTTLNTPTTFPLTVAYFPSTISLSHGTSLNSTITFRAAPTVKTIYHVRVTATYGSRLKTSALLTITVNAPVPDFYLFAIPLTFGPVDAGVGVATNVTIGYANDDGFLGTVNLSVSPSSVGSLNQSSVTATHNVTLSMSASLAKNYNLVVTGTNGTVTRSVTFTFIVVDFNLTASGSQEIPPGGSKLASIQVIPLNKFVGIVSLTATPPSGLTVALENSTINSSGSTHLNVTVLMSTSPGNYTISVTGTSLTLQHTVLVNVTVSTDFSIVAASLSPAANPLLSYSDSITVTSIGLAANVTLTLDTPPNVARLSSLNATLVPNGSKVIILILNSTIPGVFLVNVNGTATTSSGPTTHKVRIVFTSNTDVDFAITLPYSQVSIPEGATASIPVTVASENGFTGTVTFTYSVVKPTGFAGVDVPNATLVPSSLNLVPGFRQNITVVITVRNTVVSQPFGINVTGTDGFLSRSPVGALSLIVPPPGFTIISSPSTVTVGPGVQANATVTVSAVNGLFGAVSLYIVAPSGVTCSLARPSIILIRDGSNTTSLSCTGPVGQNIVTISGSGTTPYDSAITEAGSATFVVASFTVTPTPTGILVGTAQQGNAKIAIAWTNSFNGNVTFHLTSPSGLNATIDSTRLTGSGSTMIHVVSNAAGTYSLVVNATSGSYSQAVTLTITVTAPANTSIDPVILYGGIGVGVIAVIAAALLLRSRGKRSKK